MSEKIKISIKPTVTVVDERLLPATTLIIPPWQSFKASPQWNDVSILDNVVINNSYGEALIVVGEYGQKFKIIKDYYLNEGEPEIDEIKLDVKHNALFIAQNRYTTSFVAIMCNVAIPASRIHGLIPNWKAYSFQKRFRFIDVEVSTSKDVIEIRFYGYNEEIEGELVAIQGKLKVYKINKFDMMNKKYKAKIFEHQISEVRYYRLTNNYMVISSDEEITITDPPNEPLKLPMGYYLLHHEEAKSDV